MNTKSVSKGSGVEHNVTFNTFGVGVLKVVTCVVKKFLDLAMALFVVEWLLRVIFKSGVLIILSKLG